jgi:hypothetical protein
MARTKIDEFFAYSRERHSIYLRREAGLPREQWTSDKILQKFRFTNVFRELDKTTAWFRNYVRGPLCDRPEVMLATVVFRLLNRIEVGEAIFSQTVMDGVLNSKKWMFGTPLPTAFDLFCEDGRTWHLKRAIVGYVGSKGPYVTGAYIISSPKGLSKLDGVLRIISDFNKKSGWRELAEKLPSESATLESTWDFMHEQKFLGSFHSYEIVTDLRHTALLDSAPDVMSWCSIGPGARRGLNRVMGRPKGYHGASKEQMLAEMRVLLQSSLTPKHWPQPIGVDLFGHRRFYLHNMRSPAEQWPSWEMREVEHTLCEFDKYERVRTGEGRPRGVYR